MGCRASRNFSRAPATPAEAATPQPHQTWKLAAWPYNRTLALRLILKAGRARLWRKCCTIPASVPVPARSREESWPLSRSAQTLRGRKYIATPSGAGHTSSRRTVGITAINAPVATRPSGFKSVRRGEDELMRRRKVGSSACTRSDVAIRLWADFSAGWHAGWWKGSFHFSTRAPFNSHNDNATSHT